MSASIKYQLADQLAGGSNPWLGNIKKQVLQCLGINKPFWPGITLDHKKGNDVIIDDHSFTMPITVWHNRLNLVNWRKVLFKEQSYDARILGVKTCMPGGEARDEYQKMNAEVIQAIGFEQLFEKERAIITMMINRLVGPGKPNGYIKPLGREYIANRDFHLFFCGEEYVFQQPHIIETVVKRIKVFNCIQDNNPEDKTVFRWVGKIDEIGINNLHDKLISSLP